MRKKLGLERARSQKHTVQTIFPTMVELRKKWPLAGAREIKTILHHEKGMSVTRRVYNNFCLVTETFTHSRATIIEYFHTHEKNLVKQRKASRLKRQRFWAAGVNDLIAVDQHDKWKRYGLALHTGIDPFPGKIHWINVWHNNNNPKLILSYYLRMIRKTGRKWKCFSKF